ncbi:hypothetical protein TNCV_3394911 [Trichonephila clavipes]|nr:hypothetical protein TNCV_3394911 [Trichonephila clavipes]
MQSRWWARSWAVTGGTCSLAASVPGIETNCEYIRPAERSLYARKLVVYVGGYKKRLQTAAFADYILWRNPTKVETDDATSHTAEVWVSSESSQTIEMARRLENWSRLQVRAVIQFL